VETGKVAVSAGAKIADLSHEEQRQRVVQGKKPAAAKAKPGSQQTTKKPLGASTAVAITPEPIADDQPLCLTLKMHPDEVAEKLVDFFGEDAGWKISDALEDLLETAISKDQPGAHD
jgi:hypothetical protein